MRARLGRCPPREAESPFVDLAISTSPPVDVVSLVRGVASPSAPVISMLVLAERPAGVAAVASEARSRKGRFSNGAWMREASEPHAGHSQSGIGRK